MTMTFFNSFVAEGSATEVAIFTFCLLDLLKIKDEQDKDKKAKEWMEQFGNLTFEELMKREQEDDKEE